MRSVTSLEHAGFGPDAWRRNPRWERDESEMARWRGWDSLESEALERTGICLATGSALRTEEALSCEAVDGLRGDSLGREDAGVCDTTGERGDMRRIGLP